MPWREALRKDDDLRSAAESRPRGSATDPPHRFMENYTYHDTGEGRYRYRHHMGQLLGDRYDPADAQDVDAAGGGGGGGLRCG
eukprot:gene9932-biopygen2212